MSGRPTTIEACQEEIDKLIDEKNALLRRCLAAEDALKNGEVPEKYEELIRAADDAQCDCSVSQRDSGHKIGCWMPRLQSALAAVEGKK